jgi:hypothetical protein
VSARRSRRSRRTSSVALRRTFLTLALVGLAVILAAAGLDLARQGLWRGAGVLAGGLLLVLGLAVVNGRQRRR